MRKWQKTLTLTASFMLVSGASAYAGSSYDEITAYLNKSIGFTINGDTWTPKDSDGNKLYPIIYDGSSYLPLKSVAKALGATVNWDDDTDTIEIETDGDTVTDTSSASSYLPYKDSDTYNIGSASGAYIHKEKFSGNNVIAVTAELLDVEESEILADLKSGQTLADIAEDEKGWSASTFLDKLVDAITSNIENAVDNGVLTEDEAEDLENGLEDRLEAMIEKEFASGGQAGPIGAPGSTVSTYVSFSSVVAETASLLDVEESTIMTDLKAGSTLAEIAEADESWSQDTYLDKLVDAITDNMEEAEDDGDLTSDEADDLEENLSDTLEAIITKKFNQLPFQGQNQGQAGHGNAGFGNGWNR